MVTDQMEVTLIQCTDSKVSDNPDEVFRAKDLYMESTYFEKMRTWAEARETPWYILSAKHGLLAPNEIVSPYNERGISKAQAISVAVALDGIGVDRVDICAGRDYTEHLIAELDRDGIEVVEHFAGERIGTRMASLAEATEELRK